VVDQDDAATAFRAEPREQRIESRELRDADVPYAANGGVGCAVLTPTSARPPRTRTLGNAAAGSAGTPRRAVAREILRPQLDTARARHGPYASWLPGIALTRSGVPKTREPRGRASRTRVERDLGEIARDRELLGCGLPRSAISASSTAGR
jgi:hypothetical protein